MMFSWLKYRSNFISRNVRKQNMEWSNGVIFLMATFWPEGLWRAELQWMLAGVHIVLQAWFTRQRHKLLHRWHLECRTGQTHWTRSSWSLQSEWLVAVSFCFKARYILLLDLKMNSEGSRSFNVIPFLDQVAACIQLDSIRNRRREAR